MFTCGFTSITKYGVSDLSACIDYVLSKTGKSELHYIGHSQGNYGLYILLAERPEYNSKVRVICLSPISYFDNFANLFVRFLLTVSDIFQVRMCFQFQTYFINIVL